jgi:hypothetical protein
VSSFSSLVGALWYLRVTSLAGLIKSRLRRLKQPKYLAGAAVGLLYVYFVFFRNARPRMGGGPAGPDIPADVLRPDVWPLFGEIGALILFVVLAVNWLIPRRATLPFTESEIAFLFPAPVSRRMLVHYRLLGAQLGIAFTALIFTVIFGRGRGFGQLGWYPFVGWWLILALVNLHITGTTFVYSRLLNPSITTPRRRVITIGAVAAVAVVLVVWIAASLRAPAATDFDTASDLAAYAKELLHAGPMPWLLALPKLALAPYFAGSIGDFALAMIPALILLVAHYFWVVNTEVAFEEATIARAEKRAARRRAFQQGDWRGDTAVRKAGTPAFTLGSAGRPELAFLWKNLLATSGLFRPKPLLTLAAILLGGTVWLTRQPDLAAFGMALFALAVVALGMIALLGPQMARQDLRTDLANTDILKTYPLHGWQIVLGEMLTPVAMLSVMFWIALSVGYVAMHGESFDGIPSGLRGAGALSLALLAVPFVALQVLMTNAATVLFPAWVQATRDQTERGFEVLGQRLIFVASQLLLTALAILPALIVGAPLFFVGQLVAGVELGVALAAIVVAVLLTFEVWLGIRWLGGRFEKLDVSSELRP